MKILILYSRAAGYWMTCMRKFISMYGGEFIVFRNNDNGHAPFQLEEHHGIRWYDSHLYSEQALLNFCKKESPDLVYVSGWSNRKYMKVARFFKAEGVPVLCGVDNPWTNTIKQRMGLPVLKRYLNKSVSHLWIPGSFQYEFAKKLGFSEQNIIKNLYSADVELFLPQYHKNRSMKKKSFPKRFIYVGRYLTLKGVQDLWDAFIQFQKEYKSDWELWCLGTGDLYDKRPDHPKIKHFGFVQPKDIPAYIKDTGVLIMPSHYDHWGVAVHEFAAAGYPLICSDNVGAATRFLEHGINGFVHKAGDIQSLKEAMHKMSDLSDEQLLGMGDISVEKARSLTPADWAKTLKGVIVQSREKEIIPGLKGEHYV